MSTTIRSELSDKNKYWIDRHRYYELKHFCLQYPIWKEAYSHLDGLSKRGEDLEIFAKTNQCSNPTLKCAMSLVFYSDRIAMVESAAKEADKDLYDYILKGVTTEGMSYDKLNARYSLPCSKDTYYDRYRKFFWILNRERG